MLSVVKDERRWPRILHFERPEDRRPHMPPLHRPEVPAFVNSMLQKLGFDPFRCHGVTCNSQYVEHTTHFCRAARKGLQVLPRKDGRYRNPPHSRIFHPRVTRTTAATVTTQAVSATTTRLVPMSVVPRPKKPCRKPSTR